MENATKSNIVACQSDKMLFYELNDILSDMLRLMN